MSRGGIHRGWPNETAARCPVLFGRIRDAQGEAGYSGVMSAQPADAYSPRDVVRIPKTVSGVRAALPQDRREQFQTELESTPIPDISEMVERWWLWVVVEASPRAKEQLARLEAGTLRTFPAEEVFGAERWAQAQARFSAGV